MALGSLGSWTRVLGVLGLGLQRPHPSQGSLSTVSYGQWPGLGCGTCTLESVRAAALVPFMTLIAYALTQAAGSRLTVRLQE